MSIIIYPPTTDWGWMKQRPQHLMSQLAKRGHQVYFCNKTQTSQAIQEIEPNLFLVHDHPYWVRSLLPVIRTTSTQVGVWCTLPSHASSLSSYSPNWIIYDCVDEFAEWLRYEEEMVRITTLIICSSQRLYERLQRTYPNKTIVLVRNAYDERMNLHLPESRIAVTEEDALLAPDKKWVGYIGAWAPWVDEFLMKKLSLMEEFDLVVIGPEFGRKFDTVSRTHNIHFLGLKPHSLLSYYIRSLSVCIIPFLITPVTLATNPVKAYEYLAAGKPVISTDLPECRLMAPHVDTASHHDLFIEKVLYRLNFPGDPDSRIQYALHNTWEQRGEQIDRLISLYSLK